MGLGRDYQIGNNSYTSVPEDNKGGFILFAFFKEAFSYLLFRGRQFLVLIVVSFNFLIGLFSSFKGILVRRMFWGRGSFYRTSFHLIVFTTTFVIVLSGISSKLNVSAEDSTLALNENATGSQDLIYQSGTSEFLSVLSQDDSDFEIYKYVVQKDDTLSSIAKIYSKNINTLVWANDLTSSNQVLKVGQVLRIPAIDGAYYKVKKGDTLDKIAQTTKGNVQDILGLNTNILDPDNPVITEGMEIFVPNGIIPAPVAAVTKSSGGVKYVSSGGGMVNIPNGMFVNPLKDCGKYVISSGFGYRKLFGSVSFHAGVDMAKAGGCWEEAAANGTVIVAGWGGWGYTTEIDSGNGIISIYGHGNGTYAVKKGDHVVAGQRIMYMGCSGVCTGTHLHFQIDVNGTPVNPFNYVNLNP